MMNLTDEELEHLYSCVYDEVYYGSDEVVYGDGDYAVGLRSVLGKIEDEAKRRGLWWAK
jgi:hypothetical protein